MHYTFILIALLCFSGATWAQISVPNTSFTYTENFNSLPISGTGHTAVPAGWAFFETSSSFGANTTYRAGDASGAYFQVVYDTYSFGATGDSDRALGSVTSVSQDTLNSTIGACFTNNTGGTITALTVTYTGETWRVASQNRQDGLVFQYNQNTTAINGAGTWTAFTALDYFNPSAPTVGGGSLRHSAVVSATISGLNIAPGNTFCFRWLNFNATAAAGGNPNQEDALGVDDFSLSNIVVCAPPVVMAPGVTQPTCATPTGTIVVNATGIGALEYSINNGSTWQSTNTYGGQAPGSYNIKVRLQANPNCEATYGSNPVVLSSPFTASTTSDTWTGCVSTDWATPGNWADGSVPTTADNVTIPNVANDPVIMGSTAALARSVVVQAGAVLNVDGTSSLTINGSINVYGLLNAIYSEGTVQNNGQIIIGTSPNIGNYGIWNLGIFNNNGTISIDNVNSIGLYLYGGTFTNAGDIFIGSTALSAQDCIQNNGGALINTSTGEIILNRAWANGIWNLSGNVQNSGKITVGSIANTGTGILSLVPFTNNAGAEIHIDRAGSGIVSTNAFTNAGLIRMGENAPLTGSGIANVQGANAVFNNNAGGDISIKQTAVNGVQNDVNSTFNNNACATLSIFDNLNNSGTFTNAGLFTVNTPQAHTNSALTNTGIIAYPQGNPIPNVTNNEIVIAPTTANDCDVISPAFALGSPVDFTIMGIFTDEAATMSAGTYVTATNTFTPTTILAEGTYTFYVKIMDGTGGCTRIIPWQLTTEDCCDAPQAICKTATIALVGNSASLSVAAVNNGSTADCGLQSITVSPNTFNCSHVGTPQTVTLTITDVNGASTSCQTTVTIQDNTAPTITCPATETLALGANCTASLPNYTSLATTGDNCGVQSVTQSPVAGTTVSGAGNMTVTLTVTDVNGLTNTCTFTVTKVDNTAPSITCPATQTLALGANCTATLPNYTSMATTGDNCGVQGVTQSPVAGTTVSGAGNTTVTLTVTDVNGLTNSCTFTVTKVDNTAPSISCPATQTLALGVNCTATLPNYTSLATTGDNCGVQGVTQSPAAGTTVSSAGNMTVTLTVTDVNGLTNSCTFTVTKVDNTAPTITCPATQTLALGANCTATLPNYTSLATTGDNCGVQGVTQSPAAGTTVSGAGNMTITLTVTDINGNPAQCSFTVTKVDQTPPTISCPATQTLVLGANCTATLPNYTSLATTGDNCGVQGVTQSPVAGTTVSSAGNMTVTLTVTDINGLTNSCTFTVNKVDNTAPSITCPATQTLTLGANCTATLPNYTSLATTGDNCGVQGVTQSPVAGTTVSSAGNMTVTLTVTDINGLTNSCTFTVTKVDNTAPSITCPATQTLALGANCTASLANYTSLATTGDNCGVQSVTQSPVAGTTVSGAGNMTVTLTVTDVNGLTNTCTFMVTKMDNTAPTITCPTTQTLALGANCTASLPNYISLATTGDNCGVQSVTQSPVAGTSVSGAGNTTVTLTVTDVNGLTNSCTFTVTKVDNTAPSITCLTTKTLVLGANCTVALPNYTNLATTGDNCGVQGVTQSPAAGTTVSGAGNMTVTLTVTDVNGLTNSCQFTVTKMDETPPTVVCKNTTVFLNAAGNYTLLASDVFNAAASSDNCSGELAVTNISPATVSCNQANQTIPVTVTVQDAAGNSATCTAQITVQEGLTLPGGWSSNNVGNANGSGGYKPCTTANGQFTVSATGFSTSSADVLHLTSRLLCGDGEIIARVANVTGGGWAGITLRETLAPGSKKVALKTQLTSNIRREIRTVTNGAVNNLNYFRPGHTWFRLVRNGSNFVGYTSTDGTNWSFAFSATMSMTGCIYAGLFAESINTNVTTTATFDNVQVLGGTSSLVEAPQTPVSAPTFSPEVYPNPTDGEVNIDLSGYANPIGTVKVFDAYGKLVMRQQLDGSPLLHMKLDGDDGVYFLSIEVEGMAPVTKRVVIAH